MLKLTRLVLPSSLIVALIVGCGGGGSGGVISTDISGRVMDGYIKGAIVFWDCNNNMKLDAGEVSTFSSGGGNYTISVPPSSTCVLRAEIPSSAIDSDTGGAIGKSYTMSAINGRPGVISPLTTAVEMGAISEAQLNQYLPGVSLGVDYIALGDSGKNAHNAAKFYSVLLQSIGGVIKTDDVTTRSDLIKSGLGMISNDVYLGGGDLNLYKNILPSVSEFSLASSSLVKYAIEVNDDALQGDDGSKRRVIEAAVASIKKNPQAVAGGNVYWGAISMADKAWAQKIHPDAGIFQDSVQAQTLRKIIFDISDKARSEIDVEKKKVDKKLLAVLARNAADMSVASLDSAIKLLPSAALIRDASVSSSKLVKVKNAKQIARNIERLLPVFAKMPSECGNFRINLNKFIGPLGDENFDFKDGYDLIVEAVKCGSGILGTEELQRVINIVDGLGTLAHGSLEADVLEVAKGFSDLIAIVCDIGGAQTVSAVWNETIGMYIKKLVALEEINQAGDKAMDAFESATNIVINNLMKDQLEVGAALLSARVSPYLMIVPVYHVDDSSAKDGSLVAKSVTGVAPVSAVMGQSTTFTITGHNLPINPSPTMTLGGIPCQIQSSPAPTASGFTAVCTPGGTVGNQIVSIKTTNGVVIDESRTVSVSASNRFPATAKLNSVNGHYYELIDCGAWLACRDAAIARGGRLVTIRSKAENDWLAQNILSGANNSSGAWIGLTDEGSEGQWRWIGGEPVSYTNWNVGEPNNAGGVAGENYAHIYTQIFVWNDLANDNSMIFQAIVEYIVGN